MRMRTPTPQHHVTNMAKSLIVKFTLVLVPRDRHYPDSGFTLAVLDHWTVGYNQIVGYIWQHTCYTVGADLSNVICSLKICRTNQMSDKKVSSIILYYDHTLS